MRVAQTFVMQRTLLEHWDRKLLARAESYSRKESLVHSLQGGMLQCVPKVALGLGYLYGYHLVSRGLNDGNVIIVSGGVTKGNMHT